ncbi:MAG: nucleotidyl transferase AbiEii/AbiGii toxin family protein [Candidatus Aenigmatarchaeota archaeon]
MTSTNRGHNIDDKIVQESFHVIEGFEIFLDIIGDYAIGGGVATQLHLKEKRKDYERFIRRTGDVDVFVTERISKDKFHRLVNGIEPSHPYKIKSDISRTCYEMILETDLPHYEAFSIHIPRYTVGRFDKVKEKEIKNITSSIEIRTDDAEVRVESPEDIIREKMGRSKNVSGNEEIVNQWISKMDKIIEENPDIGKHMIDEVRYGIGMSIENSGFYSKRTKELLKELKVKKDAYDIACLSSIHKE